MERLMRHVLFPPPYEPLMRNPSTTSNRRREPGNSMFPGDGVQFRNPPSGEDPGINLNSPGVAYDDCNEATGGTSRNASVGNECDGQRPEKDADDVSGNGVIVPCVNMMFDSVEEAQQVYNSYAEKRGFGARIAVSRKSQKRGSNELLRRVFECSRARKGPEEGHGTTENEHEEEESILSEHDSAEKIGGKRQRNKMKRADCKAHMAVCKQGERWKVTIMKEEHTHPMMSQAERTRYYRSHRKIPREDYMLLQTLHNRNLQTSQIMATLGSVHSGVRILPYTKKDVANVRTHLRQGMAWCDMATTIEYFQKLQAESPQFYYALQLDDEQRVRAIFWVDGRTRELYKKFKDCVLFDTTFCTNRYKMPFAPIVGINNHGQTIMLGCALLPDETHETFKWVFQHWMIAMNGEQPDLLMTDQDQQMASAISEVLPNTKHRCCKWHVMKNAREKLGMLFSTREGFEEELNASINFSDTIEEFENSWLQMVEKHNLSSNAHLQNMWGCRQTWAPAYFKQDFCPFTSTTGRSEGLNSFFKKLVHPHDSVWQFVTQYDYIQETRLDREDNARFLGEATTATLWCGNTLEVQASKFYTRVLFEKFKKLLMKSMRLLVETVEGVGIPVDVYRGDVSIPKIRRVIVDLASETYLCSCNKFYRDGILCSHTLRAMVQLNVRNIPEKYMLKRWSEEATTVVLDDNQVQERLLGVPGTNTLRFNDMCRLMGHLASDACISKETYKIVYQGIQELRSLVRKARRDGGDNEEEETGGDARMLRYPEVCATKGRPKETEKRKKSGGEIRKEEAKKKQKKGPNKCSRCKEEGHNKNKCPQLALANKGKADEVETIRMATELRL